MAQRAEHLSYTLADRTFNFFVLSCLSPAVVLSDRFCRSLTDRADNRSRAITTKTLFCLCHSTLQITFHKTFAGLSLLPPKIGTGIVFLWKYFIDFPVARHVSFVIKAGMLWFTLQYPGYDIHNPCHLMLRQTRWMYADAPSDQEGE